MEDNAAATGLQKPGDQTGGWMGIGGQLYIEGERGVRETHGVAQGESHL